MATHSNTLTWKIPWTEEPVSYSPWGRKELDTTEQLHFCSKTRGKWSIMHSWGKKKKVFQDQLNKV